jgi:Flp pilus assembly protein TadD
MSLLLDALQRSQNKAKASAATQTEELELNVLPTDAPGSVAAAPDTPVPEQGKPVQHLELTLDPISEVPHVAAPDVAPEPSVPGPAPLVEVPPQLTAPEQAEPAPPAPEPAISPKPSAPQPVAPAKASASSTPQAQVAARDAAQAMLSATGAAATPTSSQGNRAGARGRRLLWGMLAGLGLAVISYFAWQYWQTTQTSSLVSTGSSDPVPPAEEAIVATEQPAASVASTDDSHLTVELADKPDAPPELARSPSSVRSTSSATANTAGTSPAVAAPSPAGTRTTAARAAETTPRPAQLVRSQTQSQLQSAWSALRQGDAARAQALYQQVLVSRPDDPDATLGLAVSLHRQQQYENAWLAYQRSLQTWPDNETARAGMLAILSESDPDTAESRLQEWVQSRPRDAAAQAALGNLLGKQGRWSQALGPLTLAQALAPDSAPHAHNLAVALDQVRRYSEALQMYRLALQLGAGGLSMPALERRIGELEEVLAR